VLIKQCNDPIEVVSIFKNAEVTFEEIKVPPELRGILIRSYLNDQSKALVARLYPEKSVEYREIKDLILNEYKLNAATYQEKFSSLSKDEHMYQVNTCVREDDTDFGNLHPCEIYSSGDELKICTLLPSQRIDMNSVSHLSDDDKQQLFAT